MTYHVRKMDTPPRPPRGFTLIELLVVISIIALLVGILLPALGAARRSAQDLKCGSNIRQLGIGLASYATDNAGKFPPNWNASGPSTDWRFWYDDDRIGQYMRDSIAGGTVNTTVGGGGFVCPRDENSLRRYAMNFWASSELNYSKFVENGYTFQADARNASQLLLLADTFACWGNEDDGWFTAGDRRRAGQLPQPLRRGDVRRQSQPRRLRLLRAPSTLRARTRRAGVLPPRLHRRR